ncbi:MAG: DJ-1/PfpI family protein [Parvibaculaceae bacterium]|nr:DJ-1/PfpI family protein [Parvibaculaceae bacterium]
MPAERTIGILLFEDAEELDFVGPFEVFTMSNEVMELQGKAAPDRIVFISEQGGQVKARKGMRVETDHSFETAPKLDVLLVPGGQGTRALVGHKPLLSWVDRVAADCEWVTSVCTGTLVLTAAGPARGKRVTTHWGFIEALRARGEASEVVENIRYVRDGNLVTSAGVSAGIDMALWLVGQWHGPAHARMTQRAMEYDPAPPYSADV